MSMRQNSTISEKKSIFFDTRMLKPIKQAEQVLLKGQDKFL
jgi:hypothetical protein